MSVFRKSTVALLAALLSFSIAFGVWARLCANLVNVHILRAISSNTLTVRPQSWYNVMCDQVSRESIPSQRNLLWALGTLAYLRTDYDSADNLLSESLCYMSADEQQVRIDGVLHLQSLLVLSDLETFETTKFVTSFAVEHGHNSALGYVDIGRAYVERYNATGRQDLHPLTREIFTLATQTTSAELLPRVRRAEAHWWLGRLALGEQDDDLAKAHFLAAVFEDPKDEGWRATWSSLMYLVDIAVAAEEWRQAHTYLDRAINLPVLPYDRLETTLVRKSEVYLMQGCLDLALVTGKQAVALNPGFVPAHVHLAKLYSVDDKVELAIEQIGIALDLNPNSVEARSLLEHLTESGSGLIDD